MDTRAFSLVTGWAAFAFVAASTGCASMRVETIGASELPRVTYNRFAAVPPVARFPPQLGRLPDDTPDARVQHVSSALERAFATHVTVPLGMRAVARHAIGPVPAARASEAPLVLEVYDRDGARPIWRGVVLDATELRWTTEDGLAVPVPARPTARPTAWSGTLHLSASSAPLGR